MPAAVGDMELLAVLESLPGAEDQGFHCDSEKPGASAITSLERDQFVYVLFFAFHAMRIQEDLRIDRLEATGLVRTILAAREISFSDEEWKDTVERRIWQFLVHEEFRARDVRQFEVVRVPVLKDETIVLDTRCLHAGASWPGEKNAYRAHFYGYERDLQKQTSEQRLNKDEYLTVDPCNNDLFPIVGWAQLNNIFKLKADLPNLKPQPRRGSSSRAEEPTSESPSCSSEPTSPLPSDTAAAQVSRPAASPGPTFQVFCMLFVPLLRRSPGPACS